VDPEVEGPAPPGNRPEDQHATKPPIDTPTIPPAADAADWKRDAYAAIESLAASGEIFSVDDVFALAGNPPRPYLISAVFPIAVKRGVIVKAGACVARDGRARLSWRGAR
jgi:hypothetical protein